MGMPGLTELMILLLLLVVAGIVLAFVFGGKSRGSGEEAKQTGDARQILDERYARGELDPEEYRQMRRDMED